MCKIEICLSVALCLFFLPSCASKEAKLIEAVKDGESGAVRALLDEDVDINTSDEDGMTALL